MKILITRPLEDGEETARQLAFQGHDALVTPLLTTRFQDGAEISLHGVQAILATSANGVRALARRTARRNVPLFAVGPQTAGEAQALGFENVKNANGDAVTLAQAAKDWASPDNGALLHVAGEGNDAKLVQMLAGFTVRQEILYAVTAVAEMPEHAATALRQGQIDAALFFSPRSASVFRDCALRAELPVANVTAVCISAASLRALAPLVFRKTRIAARPNQTSLLQAID